MEEGMRRWRSRPIQTVDWVEREVTACRFPNSGLYEGGWEMTMVGGEVYYTPVRIINSDESEMAWS